MLLSLPKCIEKVAKIILTTEMIMQRKVAMTGKLMTLRIN